MVKKIFLSFLLLFCLTSTVSAQTHKQVEIFDIEQERVVKKVPVTPDIREEVKQLIERTTSVYPKIKPIPNKGFMIKVPLHPAVHIQNQWLRGKVDQVILIFPPNEHPFYLVMDKRHRPHLFNIEGETDTLLEMLDYEPEASE
ncbi:hypothetical protein [Bacillus sp. FJAT-49736]|uniref:hypothetical protein n=1 Tax=Bacillus sp. FJAT-49736 TaxID=2833582 RepID=UPI001BC8FEFC|nr:hypothetical protein [Bacillus sp. FJAT-49736]MBS4175044.1 hypothetical protein [Bacillus sp. FJAT-49736]